MKLEKTEISKVSFKNARLQKDEDGALWLIEDLGDKGFESRKLEEVILEVFQEDSFAVTFQSKIEV